MAAVNYFHFSSLPSQSLCSIPNSRSRKFRLIDASLQAGRDTLMIIQGKKADRIKTQHLNLKGNNL